MAGQCVNGCAPHHRSALYPRHQEGPAVEGTVQGTRSVFSLRCPSCGSEHVWAKGSAWLSGFGIPSPPDKREEQQVLRARLPNPFVRMISGILGERG